MKAIRTIGFTGTIASGKTSRCKHLVDVAKAYQRNLLASANTAHTSHHHRLSPSLETNAAAFSALQPVLVHYINADLVGHNIYEPGKPCYKELVQHFGSAILPRTSAASTSSGALQADTVKFDKALPPSIDRRALGEIVFADERKLQELNAICWPYISAAIRDEHNAVLARATGNAAAAPPPSPLSYSAEGRSASPLASVSAAAAPADAAPAAVALIIVEAALLCEMTDILSLATDIWMTHCTPETAVDRVMARNGLSREAALRRVSSQRDAGQKLQALRELSYAGDIEVFDTTQVSLAEGLKETEKAFDRFWRKKVLTHLT